MSDDTTARGFFKDLKSNITRQNNFCEEHPDNLYELGKLAGMQMVLLMRNEDQYVMAFCEQNEDLFLFGNQIRQLLREMVCEYDDKKVVSVVRVNKAREIYNKIINLELCEEI